MLIDLRKSLHTSDAHHAVRIAARTHAALRELASHEGAPLQDVLERAIEVYRRQRILDATNAAYAALRADPAAWQEVVEERTDWDATIADGLHELP